MYLKSFEYLRGIAIILIVAGHCYDISGWQIDTFGDRIVANIITGGTSLFVFISGFLFHHVFYPRYNYSRFMHKKIKNVLFPYLFMSIFGIGQALIIHGPFATTYFGPDTTLFDQFIRPVFLYLVTGGIFAYWYIPFIFCIFAMSPLFIAFIHCQRTRQVKITFCLLVVSLFLHRPVDNFLVPQSIVFFTPIYLIGILCSLEKERVYTMFADRLLLLLAAIFMLAVLQAALTNVCGDLQKSPFSFNGIDLNLLQKLLICMSLMVFMHRFENQDNFLLTRLAEASFAIYFLHGWFIFLISLMKKTYSPLHGLHLLPFSTALVLTCSLLMAQAVKRAFPDHSRILIGW